VISILSFFIVAIPKLSFLSKEVVDQTPRVDLELGVVYGANQLPFQLPSKAETGDICLVGELSECGRFFAYLISGSEEEVWWIANLAGPPVCFRCFDSSSPQELELFRAMVLERSRISHPFTLFLADSAANKLVEELFGARSQTFRIVYVKDKHLGASSYLMVKQEHNTLVATGKISGENLVLRVKEDLLSSEQSDDPRDEGPSARKTLDLVGQASTNHGSPSRDEPKRFKFPFRRTVINKAKIAFGSGSSQNQISQSFAGEMRSPHAVTDIATRLRHLGHGI
jgi:hypothetical protein